MIPEQTWATWLSNTKVIIAIVIVGLIIWLTIGHFYKQDTRQVIIGPAPKEVTKTIASHYDYDLRTTDQKCRSNDCWSMSHATCATRKFPRHITLIVKNVANGKTVECFTNDYGPSAEIYPEREIDLSSYAFSQIADLKQGIINVEITVK